MTRYAKATDANQSGIVEALRRAGWQVLDMHQCGRGVFDLLVKKVVKVWVECKMPGQELTDAERRFLQWVPGRAIVVYGAEDALEKLGKVEKGEPL